MPTFINTQGQIKNFSTSDMPIASLANGQTKYANGTAGWTRWQPYTTPASSQKNSVQSVPNSFAPTDNGGGGGGGPNPDEAINREIENLYNQGNSLLDQQQGAVNSGYADQEASLNSSVANDTKKYQTEQDQLLGDTQTRQDKANKVVETALQQAIRAYNALQQQNKAQYGFGSSAGQAIGELAQQEFFRQQGDIQGKQADLNQQFEQERGRIKTYVTQKLDDLTQYKTQALAQLKQNLQNSLNEIAARRYDLQANKTKDKMSVLQNAVAQAQSISAQDLQFRQQIAAAALAKMQEVAGRAFTPREITAALSEFGVSMPQIKSNAPAQGLAQAYKPTNNKDEFSDLNPYQAG